VSLKSEVARIALHTAACKVFAQIPDDYYEQNSFFAKWFSGDTNVRDPSMVLRIEYKYAYLTEDELRERIIQEAKYIKDDFKAVLGYLADPVRDLGDAIEDGDPEQISSRWLLVKRSIQEAEV
jgi:hypothetical protein